MILPTPHLHLLTLSFTTLLTAIIAQSSTTSSTTSATTTTTTTTPTPQIYAPTSKWTYLGCYNETTTLNNTAGLRALAGTSESSDTMTVQTCLDFCGGDMYAGLEYTRECYCSQYISAFSKDVGDAQCELACVGNSSQICGGALRLSVYQAASKKSGAVREVGLAGLSSLGCLVLGWGVVLVMGESGVLI